MPRPILLALRFMAVLAALAVVASVLGPATSTGSPYGSALSDLAGSAAMASPPCDNRNCVSGTGPCQHNQGTVCSWGGGNTKCNSFPC